MIMDRGKEMKVCDLIKSTRSVFVTDSSDFESISLIIYDIINIDNLN